MDLEFFFDPVCPFCWVTSRWVTNVAAQRPLEVRWRPLSLRLLNDGDPDFYGSKPELYPDAHQRGLEMLRVVDAARERHGEGVVGGLYTALGEAVWNSPPPHETSFDAVLGVMARPRDLAAVLTHAGLPAELAEAASDSGRDETLRAETEEALDRAGGGVGTPILSFDPPDGPAFFGPVLDTPPEGDDALELWDVLRTLGRWPGFAELKRGLRSFPYTPLTERLAGQETAVG